MKSKRESVPEFPLNLEKFVSGCILSASFRFHNVRHSNRSPEILLERLKESGITSTLLTDTLRDKEGAKIECGKAHFDAIALDKNPARFKKASKVDDLFS